MIASQEEIHQWLNALQNTASIVPLYWTYKGIGMSKNIGVSDWQDINAYIHKLEQAVVMLIFKQSELESKIK